MKVYYLYLLAQVYFLHFFPSLEQEKIWYDIVLLEFIHYILYTNIRYISTYISDDILIARCICITIYIEVFFPHYLLDSVPWSRSILYILVLQYFGCVFLFWLLCIYQIDIDPILPSPVSYISLYFLISYLHTYEKKIPRLKKHN